MSDVLFEPIPLVYRGLFADRHFVDGQQFATSVLGASKIANSICHFFLFSEITHDTRAYRVRYCVGPSKKNGLIQEIFAVMNSGNMAIFTPILLKVGGLFVEKIYDAVIKSALNKTSDTALAIEAIQVMAHDNMEFAKQVHDGQMRDKAWMQDMISSLVSENRSSLRSLPEPVGRSVRELTIGVQSQTLIDEPAAEVLRSPEVLTIGNSAEYRVKVEGVFKTDGSCRLKLVDTGEIVAGKITDPALAEPGNIYTRALNDDVELLVTAKPTLKDRELKRLFISDGAVASRAS